MNEPGASMNTEFRYKCKDGNFKWIEFTGSNMLHDPDINGLLGNYKEITERKNHEQELIRAKDHAEESDRLKSAFLANMSHEIRTPMNGILGFAELLKSSDISSDKQQEFLDIIAISGERMLNIINDLVNISKIEAGQMELSYSKTDLIEQLNFLFILFEQEAEMKGLKLNLQLPSNESKILINTDKEKIYAILTNLIKNAIKFTQKGNIDFGYELKSDVIEFHVKDTGIGIPDNKQIAVFDRFVQVDSSKSSGFEGSGLGLSITKAYVEMLGGQIWLNSEEGKGSKFIFSIPYVPFQETKNSEVFSFDKSLKSNISNNSKILIVEDDDVSLNYLESVLKQYNLEVLIARNGMEAVETFQNNEEIILIFMDIKMPVMDGHTAAKKIKDLNPDIPIVAQTAFALKAERKKFNSVFDDYLTKPLNLNRVLETVNKYLFE